MNWCEAVCQLADAGKPLGKHAVLARGKHTVGFSGAQGSLDYAPLRIAFTRSPGIALEDRETCDDLLPSEAELAKFRSPTEGT